MIRVYLMFQGERVCNALYVSLSLSFSCFFEASFKKRNIFFLLFFLNFITIPRDYRIVYLKKKKESLYYMNIR